jgi:hypothetical protein
MGGNVPGHGRPDPDAGRFGLQFWCSAPPFPTSSRHLPWPPSRPAPDHVAGIAARRWEGGEPADLEGSGVDGTATAGHLGMERVMHPRPTDGRRIEDDIDEECLAGQRWAADRWARGGSGAWGVSREGERKVVAAQG